MDTKVLVRRDYKINGIAWYIRSEDNSHFYSLNIEVEGKELLYMMEEDELNHLILEMINIQKNLGYVN